MKHPRTDLALESFEGAGESSIPGVDVNCWDVSDVRITEVVIRDPQAAQQLGKPCGAYLTMECDLLRERDPDARIAASALLGEELARMLPDAPSDQPVLVVGLGNRFITPDALGPLTVDRTLVTRHVADAPHTAHRLHSVCAIAPGVLGITGVETGEIVGAIVERVHPRAVICIDSLAARASARIGSTIQLTDSGIQPGAGVGNRRTPLTQDTLGVPVIAVGMPTVVYAATLARDAFALLSEKDGHASDDGGLDVMERSLLGEKLGEMIVTPREIDAIVSDAAAVIAAGVNRALQPELSDGEIAAMMD